MYKLALLTDRLSNTMNESWDQNIVGVLLLIAFGHKLLGLCNSIMIAYSKSKVNVL